MAGTEHAEAEGEASVVATSPTKLKTINWSTRLLDLFAHFAATNTEKGIESLGILFGKESEKNPGEWDLTDLYLPSQIGTADTCTMVLASPGQYADMGCHQGLLEIHLHVPQEASGAAEVLEYAAEKNLIQLGWIHTHPTFDVYLSSVDLHNQWLLQSELPEAVAFVINPRQLVGYNTYCPCYGLYHLTVEGRECISRCTAAGFHQHEAAESLYKPAAHAKVVKYLDNVFHADYSDDLGWTWDRSYSELRIVKNWKCLNYGALETYSSTPTERVSTSAHHPDLVTSTSATEIFHDYFPSGAECGEKDVTERTTKVFQLCLPYIEAEALCAKAVVEDTGVMQSICHLENSLITLCSSDLADGMLYAARFVIDNRYVYTRYMDFGNLRNVYSSLPETPSSTLTPIEWKVLTQADFTEKRATYFRNLKCRRLERNVASHLPGTGRRWNEVVYKGKKSLQNAYSRLQHHGNTCDGRIKLVGACVHVLKTEKITKLADQKNSDIHHQSGIFDSVNVTSLCQQYRLHGKQEEDKSFREMVLEHSLRDMTLSSQGAFINAIQNDSTPSGGSGVTFAQYFSCGGEPSFRPTSVRNLLLFTFMQTGQDKFKTCLQQLFGDLPPPVKKRTSVGQHSARTKRSHLENTATVDMIDFEMTTETPPMTAYDNFCMAVIEKGTLKWRTHTSELDIICMNDVNTKTGIFQSTRFCHLSRWGHPTVAFSCDCQMFSLLARNNPDEATVECCHIRFFRDLVEPVLQTALNDASQLPCTPLGNKVKGALESKNCGIVRLDKANKYHTFSVMSGDMIDCALVTLENSRFRCLKGECCAQKGHTRKATRLSDGKLCQHLNAMQAQQELWMELVNQSGSTASDDDSDNVDSDPRANNEEFIELERSDASMIYFEEASGMWKSRSFSTHVPRQLDDDVLKNAIQKRLSINIRHPDYSIDEFGFYMRKVDDGLQPFHLYPKLDRDLLCKCGGRYWNSNHPDGLLVPKWKQPMTVYLSHGAGKYLVHDRDCMNREDRCRILYSGSEDGLHILSQQTAAGDEIGWEFIEMVMNCQTSISCFCTMKGSVYYCTKVSFMSRQTFTNWIFTWLVNFGTDFRKNCNICGDHPSVLAADGTKLGIYFRHTDVTPIENPDIDTKYKPTHKRNDRQFFSYLSSNSSNGNGQKKQKLLARHCLAYYVAKNSGTLQNFQKTKTFKAIADLSDQGKTEAVLTVLPEQLAELFSKYIDIEFDQTFIEVLNPIFLVFCSEAPLTSLINPRFIPLLLDVVNNPSFPLLSIHEDLPEIYKMYSVAKTLQDNSLSLVNVLINFCIESIQRVRMHDKAPEAMGDIVRPYNPQKQGRAYYFTQHGGQIRHMPVYELNEEKSADATCMKNFPVAAKSGTTYLFLVFDPAHYGHCYGFHIITSSEGRKDAFAPPYLYMETAPKEFFYDFSCQLEEYCLNREPKYFQNTRFWHDIFHGYSHKCPFVYSSRRIKYMHQHNTEICEQFNSYIQKVKFSARAMNQTHFTFYLQFFIDQWNRKKKEEYEKQLLTIRNLSL